MTAAPAELLQRGVAAHQAGRLAEAEARYREVLAVEAGNADALHLLGVAAHQLGRNDEAVEHIRRATRLNPAFPDAHSNLGNILYSLGRFAEAEASYREALRLRPDYAAAHNNIGGLLRDLGRLSEAAASCRHALLLQPDFPEAHNNLGNILRDLGCFVDAELSCRSALRFWSDYPEAHNNLGNALRDQGRVAAAAASYEAALRLRADYPEAHNNLGSALRALGRFAAAQASYREALRLRPDYPDAHNNLGHQLLLGGRFAEGWEEYEWRARVPPQSLAWRDFAAPRWNGEPLGGRTILLHAEQGLGDTLQFCRYAPLVAARGGRVVLEVQALLVRLLSGLPGVARIIGRGEALPPFDLHCPLLSLPRAFGTKLGTVPDRVPYLAADPERVRRWGARLGGEGFKIGVAWRGNPGNVEDRSRSFAVDCLAPLAAIPGARLISLQKGDEPPGALGIERPGADFDAAPDAFLDTAAVMPHLDLVVSCDTAVAHLAGALGRPVWIALPHVPDWRWLLARDDSPWYPSARLFRQPRPGAWGDVFARMAAALAERVGHG